MSGEDVRLRMRFLAQSRDRLAAARAALADEFARELRRCREQCIEARVLRGEDADALEADDAMESDSAKTLIREIASHPALGERLRTLAARIDELDGRLARVQSALDALAGARLPKREDA
jgi:hypothetical protein